MTELRQYGRRKKLHVRCTGNDSSDVARDRLLQRRPDRHRGAVEPWSGRHDLARILVVDETGPVGWLVLTPDDDPDELIAKLLAQRALAPTRPEPPALPSGDLTIAICTRDRPNLLRSCLERVCAAAAGRYEVVVVDNASRSDATARVVAKFVARQVVATDLSQSPISKVNGIRLPGGC